MKRKLLSFFITYLKFVSIPLIILLIAYAPNSYGNEFSIILIGILLFLFVVSLVAIRVSKSFDLKPKGSKIVFRKNTSSSKKQEGENGANGV